MIHRHDPRSAPELTAKDWGLILTALNAYQHHAAYRALHEKIAPVAKTAGVPLLVAVAAPAPDGDGNGRTRLHPAG